jgi:hypothetical protein
MERLTSLFEGHIAYAVILLLALLFILLLWNILLSVSLRRIKGKNEEFFAGGKVKNLEDFLISQNKGIKILDKDIQELYNISNQINKLAFRSYHKIGMIRFNPFKDVGGDQSFAIALLNGRNNGITLSSLYSRDGARFYAKSIINGESSKHPLTQEEKDAIAIAIKGDDKKSLEEE